MVTVSELRLRVAQEYERLGLPTWPDPHAGMDSPLEEEYSRLTDPERYRIVHARARVWRAVLEHHLGAGAEELVPSPGPVLRPGDLDRGVRLDPRRRGALPLFLIERGTAPDLGRPTLAGLDVAVARPDVVVASQPDCGCDACDSGSSDVLEAIDAAISHVIGGPFVVLRGDRWGAEWHPGGGSAAREGRGPDFRTAMDWCRRLSEGQSVRLPRRTEAFVGRAWLAP